MMVDETPNTITFAYIDGANLIKGVSRLGWEIDLDRFIVWLRQKHQVSKVLFFIGKVESRSLIYSNLETVGYSLIFRETVRGVDGQLKGNCDTEMVLQAAIDMFSNLYDQAIIISGDGDFACLVNFLKTKLKIKDIIAPHSDRCSILLKRTGVPITF